MAGQEEPTEVAAPFETEQQAEEAIRHLYEAAGTAPSAISDTSLEMMCAACDAVGVELGLWDTKVLAWIASSHPSNCAVVANLIRRANADGQARACRDEKHVPTTAGERRVTIRRSAADDPGGDRRILRGTGP